MVNCRFFAISAISVQSQQSDCNPTIRLQSQQSDCNLSNQSKTPRNKPYTLWSIGAPISKLPNFCNLSNQPAISTNRLQSPQSKCNLPNQSAISAIRVQSPQPDCEIRVQSQPSEQNIDLNCRTAILYCSGLHLNYADNPSIASLTM